MRVPSEDRVADEAVLDEQLRRDGYLGGWGGPYLRALRSLRERDAQTKSRGDEE